MLGVGDKHSEQCWDVFVNLIIIRRTRIIIVIIIIIAITVRNPPRLIIDS